MRLPVLSTALFLLAASAARAQQPALPGAPVVPAPSTVPPPAGSPLPRPQTAALPSAEVVGYHEVIGQTYSVETVGGTQFSGKLLDANTLTLTFETKELGIVTLQRANLRQLMSQTPEQARRGYDYVGNGTRMFFAPTARNLHQGEGYIQNIDVFLTSINYGITDNVSVGLLVPYIPAIGVPVLALTPKVSAPVGENFNLGAGVLFGFATGAGGSNGSAGVGYGVATYGTADNNASLGLGYGFGSNGVGSTPVVTVGGNLRISRLFSLVDETYIANGGFAGLAGLRYGSPRFSGSLGFLYLSARNDGGFYPAWLDVSYRFGKIRLK